MPALGPPCRPPAPCPSVPPTCGVAACGPVRAWRGEGARQGLVFAEVTYGSKWSSNQDQGRISELRIALLGEAAPAICHQLGLSQPGSLHASLAPKSLWKRSSPERGLRHLGSGRLFAELAGGAHREGVPGDLPRASPEGGGGAGPRRWAQWPPALGSCGQGS